MSNNGSKPRPYSVSQQEYDTRWDAIFCRDLPPEPQEEYRVNKQGLTERFREGQWELEPNQK